MTIDEIKNALEKRGWVVVPALVSKLEVEALQRDLAKSYEICRQLQVKGGIDEVTDGTVHHVLGIGDSFLSLLDIFGKNPLDEVVHAYFGGAMIINSFGGVINMKSKPSYVCNMHRDVRSYTREIRLMLNALVMLDDFTLDNGATHLLSGSHLKAERPDEACFFENADRATGRAGDVLLFDSNLWHAAGKNQTDQMRRALTLTLTPPNMKQQMDYCRLLGWEHVAQMPPAIQQILGYFSRIPSTREEWYQPREKRFYRSDQH